MIPAGAAFAQPAGRSNHDDGAAKQHSAKPDNGNSGERGNSAKNDDGSSVTVDIGDALRIERSPGEASIAEVPATAPTQSATDTPPGCPNTYHHVNTGNGANTSGGYDST